MLAYCRIAPEIGSQKVERNMKMTLVLVLYNKELVQSLTFQTLQQQEAVFLQGDVEVEWVIYDNSKVAQIIEGLGDHIHYHHDPRNIGIVAAYNYAWQFAKDNGSEWLLLLDHDTQITEAYSAELISCALSQKSVAAVMPQILVGERVVSPTAADTVTPLMVEHPKAGLHTKPLTGINSGSLIRVSFLNQIDGFNERFSLDYLDHWMFYTIFHHKQSVWVMNSALNHELSVMSNEVMSIERYKSILDSEIYFYQTYKKELLKPYKKHLFVRALKQFVVQKNKKIPMYSMKRYFSL